MPAILNALTSKPVVQVWKSIAASAFGRSSRLNRSPACRLGAEAALSFPSHSRFVSIRSTPLPELSRLCRMPSRAGLGTSVTAITAPRTAGRGRGLPRWGSQSPPPRSSHPPLRAPQSRPRARSCLRAGGMPATVASFAKPKTITSSSRLPPRISPISMRSDASAATFIGLRASSADRRSWSSEVRVLRYGVEARQSLDQKMTHPEGYPSPQLLVDRADRGCQAIAAPHVWGRNLRRRVRLRCFIDCGFRGGPELRLGPLASHEGTRPRCEGRARGAVNIDDHSEVHSRFPGPADCTVPAMSLPMLNTFFRLCNDIRVPRVTGRLRADPCMGLSLSSTISTLGSVQR
jgi:hypothetical protein